MTDSDRRSFRIGLVADRYVNPPVDGFDGIAVFVEAGWGVMQLPADVYPPEVSAPLLAEVAEQAEEFYRHGYDVVVVGHREGLPEALAALGIEQLDQVSPTNPDELLAFLNSRPTPAGATSASS